MRLLNTTTYELKNFSAGRIPPYVILSHCWGKDDWEVTFADLRNLSEAKKKPGWQKVELVCLFALRYRNWFPFSWIWIDACCIDRSSSAELSEAINSMFTYYRNAQLCLVYLSDVPGGENPLLEESSFRRSRWFKRGWTLQELIAPDPWMIFLSSDCELIGRRLDLADVIAALTNIDAKLLKSKQCVDEFLKLSIAKRMACAANRRTTRPEDRAYSLMGLFDVHMPVMYGEGAEKAFRRLQLEIIRQSYDHSIFAWGSFMEMPRWDPRSKEGGGWDVSWTDTNLLATSPDDFEQAVDVEVTALQDLTQALGTTRVRAPHFLETNYGIHIRLPLHQLRWYPGITLAAVACRAGTKDGDMAMLSSGKTSFPI